MLRKIIARGVLALIFFLFKARIKSKLKNSGLKNMIFYEDLDFKCIEGQRLRAIQDINSRISHIQVDINIDHHQNLLCILATMVHKLVHILVFMTPSYDRLPEHGEQFI